MSSKFINDIYFNEQTVWNKKLFKERLKLNYKASLSYY